MSDAHDDVAAVLDAAEDVVDGELENVFRGRLIAQLVRLRTLRDIIASDPGMLTDLPDHLRADVARWFTEDLAAVRGLIDVNKEIGTDGQN